jgi:hypothetical protein
VEPDGDGLAIAHVTAGSTTVLTRIGPDGTPRPRWPQTLTELGTRAPCWLTRRADGGLVVAAIDPALLVSPLARTADDYRLAARGADGGPVAGAAPTPAISVLPLGGLAATTNGRLVIGGTSNAGVRPLLEGRDPASGALDPGFGSGGLLSLQPASFLGSSVRAMVAVGSVVLASGVNEDDGTSHWLTTVREDGTLVDGPQTIPGSAGRPIASGIAPAVTPDRGRIYVVVGDAGNPTTAPAPGDPAPKLVTNVVALDGSSLPPLPKPVPPVTPPVTPPATAPATPTTPPAAPRVTVTVTKVVAAKGGTVTLTIRTSARGDLLFSATARSGRKSLRWGPVAATYRAAGTRTVTLRPSAAVRRALSKRRAKLSASLAVKFLPASGATVLVKRTVTLRSARR